MSNNSCWGSIYIEDKLAPEFTLCDDITVIDCYDAANYLPIAEDACDGFVIPTLLSETFSGPDCNITGPNEILKTIHRVYVAIDSHGNESDPCTVNIQLRRINFEDIECPPSWDIQPGENDAVQCDEVVYSEVDGVMVLDPITYGVPKIDGKPLWPVTDFNCNLSVTFSDTPLPAIGCVKKVMRIWTVREWFCSGERTVNCIPDPQIIEILDEEGPILTCPDDITMSTNGYTCENSVYIPAAGATDLCGPVGHVDLEWPGGFQSNWTGGNIVLPDGIHTLTFIAYDYCHNSTTCEMTVVIEDHTPPVVVCDEFTVVSVTLDGQAEVPASVFDDGSYDDCQLKSFLVRRMDDDCPSCFTPKYEGFDHLGEYNGHHYYLSHYKFRADKSLKIANAMGGYAAAIGSSSENSWIFNQVQNYGSEIDYWIGLTDREDEGYFEWINGEPFSYSNWNGPAPTAMNPGPDYVKVTYSDDGRWNDTEYLEENRFVLEVEDPCTWSSYERFCCSDIGTDVMVAFRAIDKWGNYNDCMVVAEVQDKLSPTITCPPDLTIKCEYDYVDLSVFGTVATSDDAVSHLGIPDHYIIDASGPLYDGLAYDNCDVTVTVDPFTSFNQCGIGYITRTFTATDDGGRTAVCVQRIDVIDHDPFNGFDPNDLVWPADAEEEGCENPDDYPPSVTGEPTFPGDDECSLIASTHEDQVFPFNNSQGDACFKILRHWTVIDWCQFDGSVYPKWERTQIIKVNNPNPPTLTGDCSPKSVCTFDAVCDEGYIELTMTATDDCTLVDNLTWQYKIDEFSNGSFDTYGYSNDASDEYPIGDHIIVWTVEDKCGNKTSCEQPFTIENCKAPSAKCIDGLAIDLMPVDLLPTGEPDGIPDWGMIVIWASDFDGGSDHPCPGVDITMAFSPDPSDTNKEYTCDDVGDQFVDVYAISETEAGGLVWSFCTASISIQDNNNVCPGDGGGGFATVSGLISTENSEEVSEVLVDLEGSELDVANTNDDGLYAFPAMPYGGNYTVDPEKTDFPLNGVSTLDLVLAQKHILGLSTLDTPYKIIAADINRDKRVSALDIVELRKLILGVIPDFNNNDSWRFVDEGYAFENPLDPLNENFTEEYQISPLSENMAVDFVAVKIGDLSGDAIANNFTSAEVRYTNSFDLYINDMEVQAGQAINVPVRAVNADELLGFQFTLEFGSSAITVESVEAGVIEITDDNFGMHRLNEGMVTTSWHEVAGKHVSAGDELFSLRFTSNQSGMLSELLSISSRETMAEAYNTHQEAMEVSLEFRTDNGSVASDYQLLQNTPNPFSESTKIGFNLPESMAASVTIYDVTGKVILVEKGQFAKGYNEVSINHTQLRGTGVLYYTLETDGFTATKKMVVLK